MIVTQTGSNAYEFTARKIKYGIIDRGDVFEVWCKRAYQRLSNPPRVMTREEMRQASKTLASFLDLIEA